MDLAYTAQQAEFSSVSCEDNQLAHCALTMTDNIAKPSAQLLSNRFNGLYELQYTHQSVSIY